MPDEPKHAKDTTFVSIHSYKGVAICKCGERLVEYGGSDVEARVKAVRALNSHLVSKGEEPYLDSDHVL